MNKLNQALAACLFITAILLGLRAMQALETLETRMAEAAGSAGRAAAQAESTLLHTQALLVSLRSTAEDVRRSSASQLGYYEAVGRRSALVLAEAALLLRHADGSLRRLAESTDQLVRHTRARVDSLGAELDGTARSADAAVRAANQLVDTAQQRLQSPEISATIESLSTASHHLARTAAASEQAAEGLRAIVSPERKSFLRRLLEAFIPRPNPASRPSPPAN